MTRTQGRRWLGGTAAAALILLLIGPGTGRAEQFKVVTAHPDRMTAGTTVFVDAIRSHRLIEIDAAGKVVWQCALRTLKIDVGNLRSGTDVEWIAADDTFLIAVPFTGIFRLNRKCAVVWRYMTQKVSHDADLLPNGNVLHTFGWDAKTDVQAVEVDPKGKVVWRWRAADWIDPSERRVGGPAAQERRPSFAHANAVVRLLDGDTLVSLRNFHRVVRVAPDGSIRRSYGPLPLVHEPNLMPDGILIAAVRNPMSVVALGGGERRVVFANDIRIRPIRTVEPLARGHFLLAGGEDIAEIDADGQVVWHVKIYAGLDERGERGLYKAAHVGKR
jgi:hypothetical protein